MPKKSTRLPLFVQLSSLRLRQFLPAPPTEEEDYKLEQELFADASWNANYVVLIVSSCAIATFGLIGNSTAVIIGAMLIAPLMLPLRALAFAALEGNVSLLRKALFAIAGGTLVAIVLSCAIGLIAGVPALGSEIASRTQPSLLDLGIAVAAGGMSGFAKIRKGISDALAGTAIAVALMPPLCVVGLSLSQQFWSYSQGAFLLYITNLLGIILACMLVYIIASYADVNRSLGWTLAFTSLLLLPLGGNFLELLRQAQFQAAVNKTLRDRTLTLTQPGITFIDSKMDWTTTAKPTVYLFVSLDTTNAEITPKQVRLVEKFLSKEMNRDLDLVFVVSEVRPITSDEPEVLPESDSPPAIPELPAQFRFNKPAKPE